MDSKVVNKAIRKEIFPFLKKYGFTEFNTRNALRFTDQQVDIINIQSFNSYLADGVGCTTYSFAINYYVYYKCYEKTPWFKGKAPSKPSEYMWMEQCRIKKTLNQAKLFHPYGKHNGKDRDDTWYVKEDGSNLDEVIKNATDNIRNGGFKFFERKSNLLEVIKENEEEAKKRGMFWVAADRISTLALELGDIDKAIKALELTQKQYSENYKGTLELRKQYKNKFDDPTPYERAEERIQVLRKL
jgi:hypothetical protein